MQGRAQQYFIGFKAIHAIKTQMLHRFRVGQLEVNTVGQNQLIVDPFRHFSRLLQEYLDFKVSEREGFALK